VSFQEEQMTDLVPLSSLSDEELLLRAYLEKERNPLVTELALRLEHALDALEARTESLEELLDKHGENP
jgi:hypothetical protein